MARIKVIPLALAASTISAVVSALPLSAQPVVTSAATQTKPITKDRPGKSLPRVVVVPGYGSIYVAPVQPEDTRSPRQRCVEEEIARGGGSPSALEARAIDLRCSQR